MKIILTFFAFAFLLSPACAREESKDKVLDIKKVKSAQGIDAWLVEDHSLPVIAVNFTFKGAGTINDSAEKQGLVRLLSNTMDEGAGDLTSQEFQKALNDSSISLSFSARRDDFGGSLKTLKRHKEKAFALLKLAINQPRFDEEPLERMRQANLARIRNSMGDPDWIAARLFNDIIYEGHPYALNSGGTLSSLPNIKADDLRNFHEKFLTRDRLVVGVTGDITVDELKILLDDVFGALEVKDQKDNFKTIEPQNSGKTFIYNKDIPQSIMSVTLPAMAITDPDYDALRVMNYIFGGGGFGSRLMEEAREKRGLTYGIYSGSAHQNYVDIMKVSTSTKNDSADEMFDIIKAEMTKIASNPVREEELADAKSYLIGSLLLSMTSTDKVSSILTSLQADDRSIDYLDQFERKINAVTAEDIQRVAKRVLTPENMTTIIVGKPAGIEDAIQKDSLPNVE